MHLQRLRLLQRWSGFPGVLWKENHRTTAGRAFVTPFRFCFWIRYGELFWWTRRYPH